MRNLADIVVTFFNGFGCPCVCAVFLSNDEIPCYGFVADNIVFSVVFGASSVRTCHTAYIFVELECSGVCAFCGKFNRNYLIGINKLGGKSENSYACITVHAFCFDSLACCDFSDFFPVCRSVCNCYNVVNAVFCGLACPYGVFVIPCYEPCHCICAEEVVLCAGAFCICGNKVLNRNCYNICAFVVSVFFVCEAFACHSDKCGPYAVCAVKSCAFSVRINALYGYVAESCFNFIRCGIKFLPMCGKRDVFGDCCIEVEFFFAVIPTEESPAFLCGISGL